MGGSIPVDPLYNFRGLNKNPVFPSNRHSECRRTAVFDREQTRHNRPTIRSQLETKIGLTALVVTSRVEVPGVGIQVSVENVDFP